MGKVVAINISKEKGTVKHSVDMAEFIADYGIKGDAHAGKWHRQVSLLSYESFVEFNGKLKINLEHGVFGENLLVSGIDFKKVEVGMKFKSNEVELIVTQIGKECHKGCEIRNIVGNCIMPEEGVFAMVVSGGIIKRGDNICLECM